MPDYSSSMTRKQPTDSLESVLSQRDVRVDNPTSSGDVWGGGGSVSTSPSWDPSTYKPSGSTTPSMPSMPNSPSTMPGAPQIPSGPNNTGVAGGYGFPNSQVPMTAPRIPSMPRGFVNRFSRPRSLMESLLAQYPTLGGGF
jgi:hypothetical protein